MKFLVILLSLILFNACSTYERIKENASDAYDWSKETAKDTVDGVKEVISRYEKVDMLMGDVEAMAYLQNIIREYELER